jgi:hypothetical protein
MEGDEFRAGVVDAKYRRGWGRRCTKRSNLSRGQPAGTVAWLYQAAGQDEKPWWFFALPGMPADAVQHGVARLQSSRERRRNQKVHRKPR